MNSIVTLVKKHWTWVSGLLLAIWMYISPALTSALMKVEVKHPEYTELITAALLVAAHFSPSPTGGSSAKQS